MSLVDVFKAGRIGANQPHRPLVIGGYGVEVTPRQPIGIAQLSDNSLIFGPLDVAAAKARGHGTIESVLLKPGQPPTGTFEKNTSGGLVTYSTNQRGTTQLVLGNGMDNYHALLDSFVTAEHPAYWTIHAADHSLRWPAAFTLRVHGEPHGRSAPYELALTGALEQTLILQGAWTPAELPVPEALAGPDQTEIGRGQLAGNHATVRWIDLAYDHDGVPWQQRHYYVPMGHDMTFLLTARSSSDSVVAMFDGANMVATSLSPSR